MLKGITKNCGIQTDLFVNMNNGLKKKDITVKSSIYRNTFCQFTKQEREQVLKTLQRIVVSKQNFLWIWEMAKKENKKKEKNLKYFKFL